ncbi:ribonuclease 3-like [Hibiscus syriacus]|uniref:ribonuclease 3-like n=1 Tax=Hibiscus syriacus TaxID=106335 RepID=UPI0019231351|nr:ribonuclease 3-like [Hibiscus syriacus]
MVELVEFSKDGTLYSNLEENWPNVYANDNGDSELWAHEWNDHGVCSDLQYDPAGYFKAALDLFSDRNFSNLQQVPQIACNSETQLWEIRFCYERVDGNVPGALRQCPNTLNDDYECALNGIRLPPDPSIGRDAS